MKHQTKERIKRGFVLGCKILQAAAVGTIVISSLAVPNLAQTLTLMGYDNGKRRRPYSPSDISRAVEKLKSHGMVTLVETRGGFALRLTELGEAYLSQYELRGLLHKKPPRWDGKWRVVIFDVREERKTERDAIRGQLLSWGFHYLQDSVWIYPYECEEAVELLKTAYRARHDVYHLIVSRMAYDHRFRRLFKLPIE